MSEIDLTPSFMLSKYMNNLIDKIQLNDLMQYVHSGPMAYNGNGYIYKNKDNGSKFSTYELMHYGIQRSIFRYLPFFSFKNLKTIKQNAYDDINILYISKALYKDFILESKSPIELFENRRIIYNVIVNQDKKLIHHVLKCEAGFVIVYDSEFTLTNVYYDYKELNNIDLKNLSVSDKVIIFNFYSLYLYDPAFKSNFDFDIGEVSINSIKDFIEVLDIIKY